MCVNFIYICVCASYDDNGSKILNHHNNIFYFVLLNLLIFCCVCVCVVVVVGDAHYYVLLTHLFIRVSLILYLIHLNLDSINTEEIAEREIFV